METVFCQADGTGTAVRIPVADSFAVSPSVREVPDSRVAAYQQSPDFVYANDSAYWKIVPEKNPQWGEHLFKFLHSKAFQISLFLFSLLVVSYGIYRLAKENSFTWFNRRRKPVQSPDAGQDPEDIAGTFLEEAILKYSEAGNYRMAVRYMYLRMIRFAAEKKVTAFSASATNADMVRAFQDPQQAGDFRFLATAYEYIFYGGFIPDNKQFDVLQHKFNRFQQSLEH
jgi:hypothetical protein